MGKLPGLWKRFPAAAGGVAGRGMLWRYRSAGPVPTASGVWNSGRRWQAKVGEDEEILLFIFGMSNKTYSLDLFGRFWVDEHHDLFVQNLCCGVGCGQSFNPVVMSVLLECPASQYELLHETLVHFSTHRKRLLIILQTQSQTMQTWRPSFLNLECLGCTIVLPCVTQHPVVQFPIRIQVPPSQSLPACVGPISSCAEFVQWNSPGFGHSLAKWQSQPRTRRWKGLSARAAPLNWMHWVSQWKVKLVSRFERRAVVYPCLSFKLSNLEPDQMPSLSQRWSFQDKSGHFNCSFDMFEIVSNVTHIIMSNRCSKTWGFPNIHFHTSNMHFNTSTATSTFSQANNQF